MIHLRETIQVKRPVDTVFRYISDFGNIEQWDPGVSASRKTSKGAVGKGSQFELVLNYMFQKVPMTYEITEYDPPRKVTLKGEGESFSAIDTISFETQGRFTEIGYHAEIDLPFKNRVIESLFKPLLIRVGKKAVSGMAKALSGYSRPPRTGVINYILDKTIIGGMAGFTRFGYNAQKRWWRPMTDRMDNKTVVITGATSGIGKAAALRLAELGAHLVIIGRNPDKLETTRTFIYKETGNDKTDTFLADLSLKRDVRQVARQLNQAFPKIDVLINNAGALYNNRQETIEKIEKTLATDLLSPFMLTILLMPKLKASTPSRVINISSGGMYTQKITPEDLQFRNEPFDGAKAYARAKRALVILTEIWAGQFEKESVSFHAMHPGWVDTPGIEASLPAFYEKTKNWLRTPSEGADTIVWLASASEVAQTSGRFWLDRRPRETHILPATRETEKERRELWQKLIALGDITDDELRD